MGEKYKVSLVARNEGVEYRDETDVYRFNVALKDGRWTVYLPGSKGEFYESYDLAENERQRIIPRIESYLKRV